MELFSAIYLIVCLIVIVTKLWRHIKELKKKEEVEEVAGPEEGNVTLQAKADLKHTFETINMWVNNCDQKAGILLSVVGVAITVLMTSDFFIFLRNYIVAPFVEYWFGNRDNLSFSWSRFTVFIILINSIALLITSCYYLLKAIRANTNYKKMLKENPGLVKNSCIFYGSISEMTYDEFIEKKVDYLKDLKSQIYVNSKIATTKYKNYNEGLFWFRFLLLVSVMLFVVTMFVK